MHDAKDVTTKTVKTQVLRDGNRIFDSPFANILEIFRTSPTGALISIMQEAKLYGNDNCYKYEGLDEF